MIQPEVLSDRLSTAAIVVERDGPVTWQRVKDWEKPRTVPKSGERGGGLAEGEPEDRAAERREDAAASRYGPELEKLTKRMADDAARMLTINLVCNPEIPRSPQARDLLRTQLEAEGWCGSCHKNDQTCTPIALMPSVAPAPSYPYYKGLCRWCGLFKKTHGVEPPIALLRKHHDSRTITEADVAKALGKVTA